MWASGKRKYRPNQLHWISMTRHCMLFSMGLKKKPLQFYSMNQKYVLRHYFAINTNKQTSPWIYIDLSKEGWNKAVALVNNIVNTEHPSAQSHTGECLCQLTSETLHISVHPESLMFASCSRNCRGGLPIDEAWQGLVGRDSAPIIPAHTSLTVLSPVLDCPWKWPWFSEGVPATFSLSEKGGREKTLMLQ